jgi:hypothetical protein
MKWYRSIVMILFIIDFYYLFCSLIMTDLVHFPPLSGLTNKVFDLHLNIQEQLVHIYYHLCHADANTEDVSLIIRNLLAQFKTHLNTKSSSYPSIKKFFIFVL